MVRLLDEATPLRSSARKGTSVVRYTVTACTVVAAVVALVLVLTADEEGPTELGLKKLTATFDNERQANDKAMESSLQAAIARDRAMLKKFRAPGQLSPDEISTKARLHSRMARSSAFLSRVQKQEASATSGAFGKQEAYLKDLNAKAQAQLNAVHQAEKKRIRAEYDGIVGALKNKMSSNKDLVAKAAKDSQVDDKGYIGSLMAAINRDKANLESITSNELQARTKEMRKRQSEGAARRSRIQDVVNANAGSPGALQPKEQGFLKRMQAKFASNAAAIKAAAADRSNDGSAMEAALMKANKANLACLTSKGYLKGSCP